MFHNPWVKQSVLTSLSKYFQNISRTLLFTIIFGIHCDCFIAFRQDLYNFFYKQKCASEKLVSLQKFCSSDRARSASDVQFVHTWKRIVKTWKKSIKESLCTARNNHSVKLHPGKCYLGKSRRVQSIYRLNYESSPKVLVN